MFQLLPEVKPGESKPASLYCYLFLYIQSLIHLSFFMHVSHLQQRKITRVLQKLKLSVKQRKK